MTQTTDALASIERRLRAGGAVSVADSADGGLLVGRTGHKPNVVIRTRGDAVVLQAPICREDRAHPRAVIEAAAELGTHALAIVADGYVVHHAIAAADLDRAPLETLIVHLGAVASRIAAALPSRRRSFDPAAFAFVL